METILRFNALAAMCLLALLPACGASEFSGTGKKAAQDAGLLDPNGQADGGNGGDDVGGTEDATGGGVGGDGDLAPVTVSTDTGAFGAVRAPCDGPRNFNVVGENDTVKVLGEICPQSFGRLDLLFAVDHSGSMRQADPSVLPGLNLLQCGRSRAAQRILDRIKSDMKPGDDVRINLVVFGDRAQVVRTNVAINDFVAQPNLFCRDNLGATNYRDAFDATSRVLSGVPQGNKVVYLISDGLPSTGGPAPDDNFDSAGIHGQAGLDSALRLKNLIGDLILNAVFLDPGGLGGNSQLAANYLAQLTGDGTKVRVADAADQLADRIVELGIPRAGLVTGGVSATLSAPGFSDKTVRIANFTKSTDKEGVWSFQTEAFKLYKRSGDSSVQNLFKLEVKDTTGAIHTSILRLNYREP